MGETPERIEPAEHAGGRELPSGTKLFHGQYTIENYLSHGGFGITYLARDSLNRLIVIKECFPDAICRRVDQSVRVRSRTHVETFRDIIALFIDEAHSLARLSHPNIVGVHQIFEDNETAYLAMDFIEGHDLLEMSEGAEPIAPVMLERLAVKLLSAIEYLHGEGLLHRDIAPDNILVSKDNQPILIDFGAARGLAAQTADGLGLTRTVKDGYSPQEFYAKTGEQHESSDLYSLAASLYHVMSGQSGPRFLIP